MLKRRIFFVFLCVLSLVPSLHAETPTAEDDLTIEVREVPNDGFLFDELEFAINCRNQPLAFVSQTSNSNDLINVGFRIWDLVKENRAQANASSFTASALPSAVPCWQDMHNWRRDQRTFDVSAKNIYGMETVRYRYAIIYYWGGKHQKRGEYLANVAVLPIEASAVFGYTLNSHTVVPMIQNVGSPQAPLAEMELRVNWTITTTMKTVQHTKIYLLRGNGMFATR
jgi:hypothetical protein